MPLNCARTVESGPCNAVHQLQYMHTTEIAVAKQVVACAKEQQGCVHLVKAMVLLRISGCNGNIVQQAEAHGLVGCSVVAWGSSNRVSSGYL